MIQERKSSIHPEFKEWQFLATDLYIQTRLDAKFSRDEYSNASVVQISFKY